MDKNILFEIDEMDGIEAQMKYEMYLAEETMRMELRRLDNQRTMVTEAADIQILNEAVLEVIKKYLKNVTASMQKAWDNFKNKIDDTVTQFVIGERNKKYLESDFKMKLPDDYQYPEINVWTDINQNCNIGDNLLTTSNYKQMSEYLDSPDNFLKQYYPNFVEQENGTQMRMIDVFEKRCFSRASEQMVVERNLISEYTNFLRDYRSQVEGIQADIDAINQVNNNIDQMLQQLGITEAFVLEADENNKFRSADPNDQNKGNNSKDRQIIVNYYKAMTQILTAKMRTCNKVKANALRIVINFVRLQGGVTNIKNKVTAAVQRTTNERTPQVK